MPGAQGLDVLLCLLFLLLLAPHSIEGGSPPLPPQRRFEYKLSFKSPRLAWPGVGIPFWTHHGDAILGLEEVRLAPSLRNRSGAVWSRTLVSFPAWEVETQMRVTGPGRRGTQGMVVWYTLDGNLVGSVPRRLASRDGVGIFFNSSAEDTRNSPAIRVLASDGHSPHKQLGNGGSRVLGSCHWDFRNRPYPFRARITYWQQRLRVSLSSGFTPNDPEDICIDVGPLLLTPGGYFGVSAATGALAGERLFDLQETLSRHSHILQAIWGLSEHLAQVKKQWKQQLRSPGWVRTEVGWDSAKVSTLLCGQQTLLQGLQDMRDVAARMALEAQVASLPVGTKHHFLELDRILGLLHKDLQGTQKVAAKGPQNPGWRPGTPTCLRPGIFLLFLLIQTAGFFYYVNFSRQKLDKKLQESWSLGSLSLGPAPDVPSTLGALRRQPFSCSAHV
ncbi:protein ERGIC-53-like isoform X4 [Cavia porcellus]|uniref:protein ERGIC-53-like isoform X4 n=1 Tax=Cavia porcellus TaxID=10141 RepID=UPI002FE28527